MQGNNLIFLCVWMGKGNLPGTSVESLLGAHYTFFNRRWQHCLESIVCDGNVITFVELENDAQIKSNLQQKKEVILSE